MQAVWFWGRQFLSRFKRRAQGWLVRLRAEDRRVGLGLFLRKRQGVGTSMQLTRLRRRKVPGKAPCVTPSELLNVGAGPAKLDLGVLGFAP